MPFISQRAELKLSTSEVEELTKIHGSRTESFSRIERSGILLSYHEGETVSCIARKFETYRPKVERTIDKALQLEAIASLDDLPRKGKPSKIPAEAKVWVLSLACQKPKNLGYAAEVSFSKEKS